MLNIKILGKCIFYLFIELNYSLKTRLRHTCIIIAKHTYDV